MDGVPRLRGHVSELAAHRDHGPSSGYVRFAAARFSPPRRLEQLLDGSQLEVEALCDASHERIALQRWALRHDLKHGLEGLAELGGLGVRRNPLQQKLRQPLCRVEDRAQRLGSARLDQLVDVDLVHALGPGQRSQTHVTAGLVQHASGLESAGLAGSALLGVVADDDALGPIVQTASAQFEDPDIADAHTALSA